MRESPESPRMFKSNWLDALSRSPWWLVPLIWLPASASFFGYGQNHYPMTAKAAVLWLAFGWIAWTASEYLLHRFVFHFQREHWLIERAHFFIHGVHHLWPNDRYRLVMPPAVSALLCVPFSAFFYSILGPSLFYVFFAGYLLGYVQYECTHYAVHHIKFKSPLFTYLKRHHLSHHFSKHYAEKKFGVSTPVWDFIFRTYH